MDENKTGLERDKAILEFLKHMATLTGAALVFVAGFAEKFVKDGNQTFFAIAIFAFLISIALSLVAYSVSLFLFFGRIGSRSQQQATFFAMLVGLAAFAMLVGFGAIAFGAGSIAH